MYKNNFTGKCLVIGLILCMFFSMIPGWQVGKAEAADEDLEITFGNGTKIGNLSHEADNAFLNFNNGVSGFKQTETDSDSRIIWDKGDIVTGYDNNDATVRFRFDMADADASLKKLAESGDAEFSVGWKSLEFYSGFFYDNDTIATVSVDGNIVLNESTKITDDDIGPRSKTMPLKTNTVIDIYILGTGTTSDNYTGARGMFIKFQDKNRPTLTGYTFTSDGAERLNNVGQQELYVKQNEDLNLTYNFSEPVKPTALNSSYNAQFLRHPLFVNPDGTGLPAAGQQQYLLNNTYTASNLDAYKDSVNFQYTGSRYHNSGNLPLTPKITGTTSGVAPIDQTLEEKFKHAKFADAAGNLVNIHFPGKASDTSEDYLKGQTVNPFDYTQSGYRVIVDAVPPKYTKVGNGIQPDILTGVVVNSKDSIDFVVQFTEEAIVKKDWDTSKTYLLFDNGMKAYYTSGSGTAIWKFRMQIPTGVSMETPLLKVIALTNDGKSPQTDGSVLQDYAGNLLVQPANYDGTYNDGGPNGGETTIIHSKIDWAALSIDNSKPDIGYRFETGGASDTTYQKNGKVTIDANDPAIKVASLDPITGDRGKDKPSKGIYRPSNMTGSSAPAVGLVYYLWSRDAADPFASKAADNFAALKRYSLTAKQPSQALYPGSYADLNLKVANNKTNLLAPPAEALTDAGTGIWYLHTWTADMTWDSARQLMQYEKKKTYVENNSAQYEAWKTEATGSDADKTFAADNKALAAVGQYDDLAIWPLSDFKEDDSNWSYKKTEVKYDNSAPILTGSVNGDKTANVTIVVEAADAHSGVNKVWYQWVKDGIQPQPIDWKDGVLASGLLTASTSNEVTEDGKYRLYVKAVDQAGNEVTANIGGVVTVDSTAQVIGVFEPAANENYVKSHDVIFRISGVVPASVTSVTYAVYSTYIDYAYSTSSIQPADNEAFTRITAFAEDTGSGVRSFKIPADSSKNGQQYIHIKVKAADAEKYYNFTQAYKFDNQPPSVTFSMNGVAYAQPLHEVTVTVTEPYSSTDMLKKYQWVKDGDPAPEAGSGNWKTLDTGLVGIDNTGLAPGAVVDYKLYVFAADGAGNSVLTSTTGIFKVSAAGGSDEPAAVAKSDLVYIYGDEEDGYTAIIKLGLDTQDMAGYTYSISPDGGVSWVKWRPFTNFVAVKVATNNVANIHIQVKYKTGGGVMGEPTPLNTGAVFEDQPVYALATLSTTKPISPATGINIDIAPPPGIKVVVSTVNPSVPVRTGNSFNVKANGYYSFQLTDVADPTRKDTLIAVVQNIDGTPPQGTIEYLTTGSTNSNVAVRLHTSEPVSIINNGGHGMYNFTENGSFTFSFRDEAGNTNTATATVTNIDKEVPRVRIVRSYTYGDLGSQTFGTVRDSGGHVLLSSGVSLEVQKEDAQAKDFTVLSGPSVVTLKQNGTAAFTVSDVSGNITTIKETVTNILSEPPQAEHIAYAFVDDAGNPLPGSKIVSIGGQSYAKGKVKVTLSGTTSQANVVYAGVAPTVVDSVYTNIISGQNGAFTYSRIYSAEGSTSIAISDLLGNVNKVPIIVKGLDNTAPEISLNVPLTAVLQNKPSFNFSKDLGGYKVSDHISAAGNIAVSISGLDLTHLGRQQVTYTAKDQVGNTSTVVQEVIVLASDGMLIIGNQTPISAALGESALFDSNKITFTVTGYNRVKVNGQNLTNEWGTYDLLYQSGLYREGQVKYIASKITYKQLVDGQYTVTFPKAGWYTLIVRNQEREREFATFFIGKTE